MAETSLDVAGAVRMVLTSAAAGFAFAESVLAVVESPLTKDGPLLTTAARAAGRVGVTGVGVVTACLAFTSALLSLGTGLLLATKTLRLLTWTAERRMWLPEAVAGVSIVLGAVATGTLTGVLPVWAYLMAQCILVVATYLYTDINEMTTVLLIVFTTLFFSVQCGTLGIIVGLLSMGLTVSFLSALRKALSERAAAQAPAPQAATRGRLIRRLRLYVVAVATAGFLIGLGATDAEDGGSEADVALMLDSVLWVGVLSTGLTAAALGTVAMVALGPAAAGTVAVVAAVLSSVVLRIVFPACSVLGERGSVGAVLGAATAAGLSLGAANVGVKAEFRNTNTVVLAVCSVVVGATLALRGLALTTILPTTTELLTVVFVSVVAFSMGAPRSPFHTEVNLRQGPIVGIDVVESMAMETINAAAAPLGSGALGAAALGTAALGTLGTAGVLLALLVALVKTLSVLAEELPAPTPTTTTREHND